MTAVDMDLPDSTVLLLLSESSDDDPHLFSGPGHGLR